MSSHGGSIYPNVFANYWEYYNLRSRWNLHFLSYNLNWWKICKYLSTMAYILKVLYLILSYEIVKFCNNLSFFKIIPTFHKNCRKCPILIYNILNVESLRYNYTVNGLKKNLAFLLQHEGILKDNSWEEKILFIRLISVIIISCKIWWT